MRIAFCIGQLTKGGAERVVCNLANSFSKKDDISIISLRNDKLAYKLDKSIKTIFLDEKKERKIKKNYLRYKKLKKLLVEENYDIIICFLPEPSFLVLLLKKFISSKVIVSVRNDPRIEYKNLLYKILMKNLYIKADGFVFQTPDAQHFFSNKIQKKSVVILNSINPDFFINKNNVTREKLIVSVGRLEPQKNQKNIILAFANISKKFPDYKLVIYGEGSLRKELENLIAEKNMINRIFLPGISNDIRKSIERASIFILSSDYEGLPNSLMEAMALGIPCISTDCPCGGPRLLIKSGNNGFLVPVNNVVAIENKIKKLLSDRALLEKISKESSKIAKVLNPVDINNKWYDYIKGIVKE